MDDLLKESKEIFEKAVSDFNPYAIVVMVSGGDDSLTTLAVAKHIGIKVDFVIHGNTRLFDDFLFGKYPLPDRDCPVKSVWIK